MEGLWLDEMKIRQKTVHQASACSIYHSTGDIFIVCLTKPLSSLKLRSAVSAPGNDSVTVPVVTRTEFALMPPREEGNETDAAIRNWEGVYQSVTEFFKARKCQSMSMPAVSAVCTTILPA